MCPVKLDQSSMLVFGWLSRDENHGMISTAGCRCKSGDEVETEDIKIVLSATAQQCYILDTVLCKYAKSWLTEIKKGKMLGFSIFKETILKFFLWMLYVEVFLLDQNIVWAHLMPGTHRRPQFFQYAIVICISNSYAEVLKRTQYFLSEHIIIHKLI